MSSTLIPQKTSAKILFSKRVLVSAVSMVTKNKITPWVFYQTVKEIEDMWDQEVSNLHGDVRWIWGKLEGRQEATSNQDAKTALWIALGSAFAGIVSLIKSFWM